jgi:hypothetical protein
MALGTRVGNASDYIPQFSFLFEWPEDISERRHNQFAKQAMRVVLEKYHGDKRGFPRHFTRQGRKLYDYLPRKPKYERWKQRKYGTGSIDIVKRGRTRQWMTSAYRLTVGGTAANRTLNGTLKLTFPFKGGSGRFKKPNSRGAITIQRLILELQRFADDEPRLLAQWFREEYMRQVDEFRRGRKRKRIRS